jgi:hypothetical protein
VTADHLEAATDAGAAADLCALPSASHIVAGKGWARGRQLVRLLLLLSV